MANQNRKNNPGEEAKKGEEVKKKRKKGKDGHVISGCFVKWGAKWRGLNKGSSFLNFKRLFV